MNTETTTNRFFTKFTDLKDFKKKLLLTNTTKEYKALCKSDFFNKLFSTHANLRTKDYMLQQLIIPQNQIQIEDDWKSISFILSYIYCKGIHIATKVIINGKLCILYNEFSEEMKDFLNNVFDNPKKSYFYIKKLNRYCEVNNIGYYRIQVSCDFTLPKFQEIQTKDDCSILLENKDDMVITKCNHIFSKEALNEWLKTKDTCPLCRTKLQSSKEIQLFYKNYGDLPIIETPTKFKCLLTLLS